ncbi:MAG: LacI family DNA-binding transcriptional regulator [Aggregatilineales bacterium]
MAKNRVTITDIAQEAKVSKQTVSRVINNKDDVSDETREQIQAIIRRRGYRPNSIARNLAFRRSVYLGLVFPNVDIPLFVDVIRGVEHVANQNEYHILLKEAGNEGTKEEQVLTALEDFRVDGVIMVGPLMPTNALATLLNSFEAATLINVPDVDTLPDHVTTINVDSYAAMAQLTEYLVQKGRRRFAYLNGPVSFPAVARKQAIVDTLSQYGLQLAEDHVLRGHYTPEFGYEATKTLLTRFPDIDTILCFDDRMAIGALKACADLGRKIPDEIAIAGAHEIPFSSFTIPTLTTISVPRFEMGIVAAESVFDRLNNKPTEKIISIKPEIIFRESTPL